MTIKAILRDGRIQPLEPLPTDWEEGQELVVEQPSSSNGESQVAEWAKDLDGAVAEIPAEEHDRFRRGLEGVERESKEDIRREWGLT